MKQLIGISLLSILLASCNAINLFEQQKSIPNQQWKNNFIPTFSFTIQDTNAYYRVYLVLRHTDAYNYNNIWLNIAMQPPADTVVNIKRSFQLGNNQKWLGTAMADVIEHRLALNQQPLRMQMGLYKFSIQHVMREEPLQHILQAGIRIEKVQP
jgi:gliding motility-associated lipoprotein GldH